MNKLNVVRSVGLVLFVGLLIVLSLTMDIEQLTDQERIRQQAEANLLVGALLFIGISITVKLLFIPASPLSLIAGFIFGGWLGTLLSVVAITLSSLLVFFIGKKLGRRGVRELIEDKWQDVQKYDDALEKHGFVTTLVLRVVPTLPLSAVNLGLAVTKVRTSDFALATVVGILPGVFLLANMGSRATNMSDPLLWVYAVLFVLMISGTAYWGWRRTQRE